MSELFWLDKAYEPGCIFRYMKGMDYETVVALDIGHGECVAYRYYKNNLGKWDTKQLNLNADHETKIFSCMTYARSGDSQNEVVVIGAKAAEKESQLIVNIKSAPDKWKDDHEDAYPPRKNGILMKDFIRTLWKGILDNNTDLKHIDPNKVLITIGCPASPDWTNHQEEYCQLAREATGYAHVTIIPESTAAIMSVIYSEQLNQNNSDPIDLRKGVAIYDLGSSTIDFTFIYMGKVIITRSLELGGYNIDLALLEMVVRGNDINNKPSEKEQSTRCRTQSLLPQERERACAQLRFAKEDFFDGGQATMVGKLLTLNAPIEIHLDPEQIRRTGFSDLDQIAFLIWLDVRKANPVLQNSLIGAADAAQIIDQIREGIQKVWETGQTVNLHLDFKQNLNYTMNKDLMKQALTLIKWDQLKPPYSNLSWYDNVKSFFENTKLDIEKKNGVCGAVVLTGGTSKVACVREIAEKCYGREILHHETDTSISVAMGMAYATGQEVTAAKLIPDVKEQLKKDQMPYFKHVCTGFGAELYDLLWDAWGKAAERLAADRLVHTEKDWDIAIEQQVLNRAFLRKVQKKLHNYLCDHLTDCIKDPDSCPHKNDADFIDCRNCANADSCISMIRKTVNDLSAQIYKVDVTTLPQIPEDTVLNAIQMIDIDSVRTIIDSMKPAKLAKEVETDAKFWSMENRGGLRGAGRALGYIGQMFADRVFHNDMDHERCKHAAAAFKRDEMREGERSIVSRRLGGNLEEKVPKFKEVFSNLIEQQLEVALGIVLFQIFEDSDMK